MKVLFISTDDTKYGAPKSMKRLISILKNEYNVQCVLLTNKRNDLCDWCDEQGIENYQIYYRDIMSGDIYESHILNYVKHVIKYIRYIKGGITQKRFKYLHIDFKEFDIIHTNTNRVDIGAWISKEYGIPHIWHLREMDEGVKNMHYYMKNWNQFMNNNANRFIAITNTVKNSWIRHGLDESKIEVVYNGINETEICPKTDGLFHDKIRIVVVGRIERAKGQLEIVQAMSLLPEDIQDKYELDLIGDAYPDYRRLIENCIREKGCRSQIHFCGYSSTIGSRLKDYDIGVTCSAAEAFGRSTIEYMMANLLVIASDTGANRELIKDGHTGIIYKYHDIAMLKDILTNISENKEYYRQVANNGRSDALRRFNSNKNADEIYRVYNSVLNIQ